jgi:hypothetical protein
MVLSHRRLVIADRIAYIERGEWPVAHPAEPGENRVLQPRNAQALKMVGCHAIGVLL